jgi:beta-lactamase class A
MVTARKAEKEKRSRRKLYRVLMWCGGAVVVVIVAAQLLYPAGKGLPLASVAGKPMTLASSDDMAKVLADAFDASKVKLAVGNDKTVEYSLKSIGAELNTEQMIAKLSDYPLWQRFIPGSILWQQSQVSTASVYYSGDQLTKFTKTVSGELSFASMNARLAIKDGNLVATDETAGSEVNSDELMTAISSATMSLGGTTTINVPAKRVPANLGSKDLEKVKNQAEQALAHTMVISAVGQQFYPTKSEIASWILLSTDKDGKVSLSIDRDKVKAYIAEVNKKVGTAAGQINITIVNGIETGRTSAATGRAIDSDNLAGQISEALLKAEPKDITLTANMVSIQPSVIYNSKYTSTQAGLQAYADDVARDRNMHISIRQLTGEKWAVDARATESIPSASTYKLFIALILFDRIDSGEIHWDDPMLDTTVAGCFERMTVASTNPCAEKWIAMFGRDYINNYIYAKGFSTGTSFTTGGANQTTAADLTKYMIGLHTGTLLNGANRARLLDSLGRHPYRYGIPTGSKGVVHDKVGFLWDYVHDAGIVEHPRGTYVMTVMTKGQSYAAIATVTREVERIMYP